MADLPLYLWVLVLIGVIGIPAATAGGLFASTMRVRGNLVRLRSAPVRAPHSPALPLPA